MELTAVLEKRGKWWIASVEELPGANAQGRTEAEALENLRDAVALILEANRELARRSISKDRKVIRRQLSLTA